MKYDITKCNNLNFKLASGLSGFMKVSPKGDCYLYQHDGFWDADAMMQKHRFWKGVESAAFNSFVEDSELQIVPRNPETYTDWKVGDRFKRKETGRAYEIITMSGDVAFIRAEFDGRIKLVTATSDLLPNYYQLILTDYEQELLAEQEKKEKCPFKKGDMVLVRNRDDDRWRARIFDCYHKDLKYKYECKDDKGNTDDDMYIQCLPFNERTWELLGTTDGYKTIDNNESH